MPLNYAILRYFMNNVEGNVSEVMESLKPEYIRFRAFKEKGVIEALMTAEVNGLLEEARADVSPAGKLRIYYRATEYGRDMISKYIPEV
jgi:DNA-binding PadR family transcriptional regulator